MGTGADCSSRRCESCGNLAHLSSSGRTYPALFPATLDSISSLSSASFENAGRVTSDGEFLTLSISESPKNAAGSSLSAIFEKGVSGKYYFTRRQLDVIMAWAERNKSAPRLLLRAGVVLRDSRALSLLKAIAGR